MAFPIAAVLGLVATHAPQLVRRLAGARAGDVADKIATVAKAVTGTDTVEAAERAIAANPELAAQVKLRLAELELDEERLELADIANARQRDLEVRKTDKQGKNTRADVMVACDVLGLVACVVAAAVMQSYGQLDGVSSTLLTTFASYFGLSLRDAHQFEFGSSRGSREKDAALKDLASAP